MKQFLSRAVGWIARIGADPHDIESIRLRKSLLVVCAFPFALAAIAWGLLYVHFGEPLAGAIPLGYAAFSLISIVHFGFTRRYQFFRFSQLALILLLPFLLMTTLGGFVSGSAVIVWSVIAPMGAMLFDKPRRALRWFVAFAGLVGLSGVLQLFTTSTNHLSPETVVFFFTINLVAVGGLIFMMVYYFVGEKNTFERKSEALLLNILPRDVVDILRLKPRTIADYFENASVLFADVVNFTPLSETMTPPNLVDMLNDVFSYFDSLAEKYDLEKIKTIGDCYMVASGVPRPRPDHAHVLTRMALEMLEGVRTREFHGHRLAFRIGINSGPVVAGVIGRRKFSYDLWGDTVNTASRMESHGDAGVIQVTRATYELIKDEFACERRGVLSIKGKGEMEVWCVTGPKHSAQPAATRNKATTTSLPDL
jgi:adenylate cyclase